MKKKGTLGSVLALQWLSVWLLAAGGGDLAGVLRAALLAVVLTAIVLPPFWWVRRWSQWPGSRKPSFWITAAQMAALAQAAVLARYFNPYPVSGLGLVFILTAPVAVAEYYERGGPRE